MAIGVEQSGAAPDQQVTLHRVYITDVRDAQFVVSWTTDTPSDGRVEWGLTTTLGLTTTDAVVSTTSHYVTITGLVPARTYYFQVRSGTSLDNNHGAYYSVTTSPTLDLPGAGKEVYGNVYQQGGMIPVNNAVVYLQLLDANSLGSTGGSQLVTARTDASGSWFYSNLYDIRTSNGTAYFTFSDSADQLQLMAQGGSQGTNRIIAPVPATYPAQLANLTLDATPNAVTLVNLRADAHPLVTGILLILIATLSTLGVLFRRWKKRLAHA